MTAGAPSTARPALDTVGAAAPPRANGELVFAEPWESRAFGMAVTLAEAGVLSWDGFRDALVGRIAAWEAEHAADDPSFRYYRCWLHALEDQLIDIGALGATDVVDRSDRLAQRPSGHDHVEVGHGHGH